MALIHDLIAQHLPSRRRVGSKGWITANAVCCHHRGHRQDNRARGNLLFTPEGSIVYNCYNCGFKTVYDNATLSKNFENLMLWLGVPSDDIKRVKMDLLHNRVDGVNIASSMPDLRFTTEFKEVELPKYAIPFESMAMEEDVPEQFMEALAYLSGRGDAVLNGWNYHWSPSNKKDLDKRIIIPFYHKDKVVGWTARYAGKPPEGTPRYYNSDLQPGYLFNCDVLHKPQRKFVTIVEGPFDAIAIDGVGTLGSELSKEQVAWINSTDKEKIVVPDRQRNNQGLIDAALANGWAVSFPDWEDDIKDAADASCRYGKLYTLNTILRSYTKNQLQIGIKRRMFKS